METFVHAAEPDAGFEDIVVRDYSENIVPMTRFFFLLAFIPYLFIRLFRLEKYFINAVAGVESYKGRDRNLEVLLRWPRKSEMLRFEDDEFLVDEIY
jgi:hypothetical protein